MDRINLEWFFLDFIGKVVCSLVDGGSLLGCFKLVYICWFELEGRIGSLEVFYWSIGGLRLVELLIG